VSNREVSLQMATSLRLAAILLALAAAAAPATAQVEIAPPPHPALDEVVKEYLRLELPLPPKDAVLVRLQQEGDSEYSLAFRTGPADKPSQQRFSLVGRPLYASEEGQDYLRTLDIDTGPLTDGVILGSAHSGVDRLCLAVIFKLRGKDDTARAIYRSLGVAVWDESPIVELREFKYWLAQWSLMERGDRKQALRDMRPLAKELERDDFPKYPYAFKQLEKTLAPNTAPKGSTEWLINDLVNHWEDESDPFNEEGMGSYFKLVELGFDAVPALIEHFDDDRYTQARLRSKLAGVVEGPWYAPLEVGAVARDIVQQLSGLNNLDAAKARKWFAEAKKVGEMKHLWSLKRPDENVMRIIGVKYPKELDSFFYRICTTTPGPPVPIPSLLASRLTTREKIAFFQEYLDDHDSDGFLEAFIRLDAAVFQSRLTRFLKEDPVGYFRNAPMVLWSADPRRWAVSLAKFHKADFDDKLTAIHAAGRVNPSKQVTDPQRETRLRFLTAFIDDPSEADGDARGTVRDHAAAELGGLLGFPVKRRSEDMRARLDPNAGPVSRMLFRARVLAAARAELARLKGAVK
jgi:hypothetical protein